MKKILILFSILLWHFRCPAQVLYLQISNPQPRVGQTFTVSVDADTLAAILFNPISNQFKVLLSDGSDARTETPKLAIPMTALKKGKNIIGPLSFEFNGTKYTTSKLEFEVVDSLPAAITRGLWIRKVMFNEFTFAILIEERLPEDSSSNDNGTSAPGNAWKEVSLISGQVGNATAGDASSSVSAGFSNNGKNTFTYYFRMYNFSIIDKSKPVIIRRNAFENLPPDYKLEDIVVK